MKRTLKMTAFALIIMLGSSWRNTLSAQYDDSDDYYENDRDVSYQNDRDVSYQTFYDELSPHGNWIEYPGHGYVWQPTSMGNEFRPYSTGGHWVWSDQYEWVWVSDYDWGWAPFHYGRWFDDPSYGWLWVPGYEWSGAWVTWRDGGDYYGWAPIRPGISINVNFNIGGYTPPVDYWCFVPRRHILSPRIYSYCYDRRQNVTIINHTTIINNYNYGDRYGWRSGPRRYDVERYAGRITPVRFRESGRPGRTTVRNNEVSIFRPNVRQNSNGNVAPRKFDRADRNRDGQRDNTTVRNNNGGIRRNNSGNTEVNPRTNSQPTREQGNTRRFERRTDNTAQPQSNGNDQGQRRRMERPERSQPTPGTNQPTRDNPVVRERKERPQVQQNTENTDRRFERRQMPQQQERVRTQPQPQQRQERVRTQQQPQQQERVRTQPQPQQRQERVRTEQQTQPRQVERGNGQERKQQNGNGSSDDRGNGKRRF